MSDSSDDSSAASTANDSPEVTPRQSSKAIKANPRDESSPEIEVSPRGKPKSGKRTLDETDSDDKEKTRRNSRNKRSKAVKELSPSISSENDESKKAISSEKGRKTSEVSSEAESSDDDDSSKPSRKFNLQEVQKKLDKKQKADASNHIEEKAIPGEKPSIKRKKSPSMESDSDDEDRIRKAKKSAKHVKSDSNSEDSPEASSPLATAPSSAKKTSGANRETKSGDDDDDKSSDSDDGPERSPSPHDKMKQNRKRTKSSERSGKKTSGSKPSSKLGEDPLKRYKSYLTYAGIRINNYKKFYEGISNLKKQKEKIVDLLHEKGLKGVPTVEACKKLRIKNETKAEVEELKNNPILSSRTRTTRSAFPDHSSRPRSPPATKRRARAADSSDEEGSDGAVTHSTSAAYRSSDEEDAFANMKDLIGDDDSN